MFDRRNDRLDLQSCRDRNLFHAVNHVAVDLVFSWIIIDFFRNFIPFYNQRSVFVVACDSGCLCLQGWFCSHIKLILGFQVIAFDIRLCFC